MDPQIEEHIKACHPCQVTSRPERTEPVCPTELPEKPWIHLAIDVCGPFPTGESVVVLTDYYSMARGADPKVSDLRQHFSLARRSVCYTWLPIPNQV